MARPFRKQTDLGGGRLIGLSEDSDAPVVVPHGHSLLLSAAGGGKTTRGAMPWLFSLLASSSKRAVLIGDAKNGEMAVQVVPMLAELGVKVAVIDDLDVWPELRPYRVSLNAFGAAVATYRREPRDVGFVSETITHALIEDPPGGPDKNHHFRQVPREFDEFGLNVLLARRPETATPGGVSTILNDPDMFRTFAEIEAEEGGAAVKALARTVWGRLSMRTSANT